VLTECYIFLLVLSEVLGLSPSAIWSARSSSDIASWSALNCLKEYIQRRLYIICSFSNFRCINIFKLLHEQNELKMNNSFSAVVSVSDINE